MAYEHRIFIVEKTHDCYGAKVRKYFGKVLCCFNLGAVDELFNFVTKYRPTDHFIYQPGNGDEEVVEDMYGDPLTEIPIEEMIWDLREILLNSDTDYPCIEPLIEVLRAFKYSIYVNNDHRDLVCLHFGY